MGRPAASVAPLRIGIVGIGFGQAAHVPAFRAIPGCVVQAIAASETARARRAAEHLGVPDSYGGWNALVRAELDVIAIAVPPDLQPAVVMAAAARGLHVFCEKPLAADLQGARAAAEAVSSAGVTNAIDFEFPELPEWANALDRVRAWGAGAVREVSITWHVRAGTARSARSTWKASDSRGGGAIGGFVAHAIYHARVFLGEPRLEVLQCETRDADDETAEVLLELAGGTGVATIRVRTDHDGPPIHRIDVFGLKGVLTLTNATATHAGPFTVTLDGRVIAVGALSEGDRRAEAVSRLAARFISAIRGRTGLRPSVEDGLHVQEVIETIRRRHAP